MMEEDERELRGENITKLQVTWKTLDLNELSTILKVTKNLQSRPLGMVA